MQKPDNKPNAGEKRKKGDYDPGEPADPTYAVYTISDSMTKSQQIRKDLNEKKRLRNQQEQEAQQAHEAEEARMQQQDRELTQDEIDEQNYAMERDN